LIEAVKELNNRTVELLKTSNEHSSAIEGARREIASLKAENEKIKIVRCFYS
jgi:hypothetical protein